MQNAGIEKFLLTVFLFVRGKDQRTDAVRVYVVKEDEGLFRLGCPLEDICLHDIALF